MKDQSDEGKELTEQEIAIISYIPERVTTIWTWEQTHGEDDET